MKSEELPWDSDQVDTLWAGEDSSDEMDHDAKVFTPQELLMMRAEVYQEYMKKIPFPMQRGSVIPFTSWIGLGQSIKQLYNQPLHYLTNVSLKQWDQWRSDTEDDLDSIIHPRKAEVTIWLLEEVNRRCASHHHLAKLWEADPMYHAFIDPIIPALARSVVP
ncbi:hypothetical protein ACFE04_004865 [Oxalis oulophora]